MRLNSSISDGTPDYDTYKKITIEHVFPQNPKSDSHWVKWFSIEEKEKYLHCLGNLVLLSRQKNRAASNYDFELKKKKYFNNPVTTFALTVKVLEEQEWTAEIIKSRQKKLLGELKKIWRLKENNETIDKDTELLTTQTETFKEPVPYAPDGFSHLSPQIAELCESVYEEPVRLIHWQINNNNNECEVYESLTEAQQRLEQKLYYYMNES